MIAANVFEEVTRVLLCHLRAVLAPEQRSINAPEVVSVAGVALGSTPGIRPSEITANGWCRPSS